MSLSQQFKSDEDKIKKGVPVQYAANPDKTVPTFFISRASAANKDYQKELRRTFKPHETAMRLKTLSDEKAGELLRDVFAKTVLLGWENVLKSDVTGNKEDIGYCDFNKENAVQLFVSLPDLFDDLNAQANDAALFRDDSLEANAKN